VTCFSSKTLVGVLLVGLVVLGVLIDVFWEGTRRPIMQAESPDGISATVYAYAQHPLSGPGFGADLVIRSRLGEILFKTNLLENRDALSDFPLEFRTLTFRDGAAILETSGNHYKGTNRFRIGGPAKSR
jgi:hypothetical protein